MPSKTILPSPRRDGSQEPFLALESDGQRKIRPGPEGRFLARFAPACEKNRRRYGAGPAGQVSPSTPRS